MSFFTFKVFWFDLIVTWDLIMKLCRKCRLEIFLVLKDRVNIRRHVSDIQPFKY